MPSLPCLQATRPAARRRCLQTLITLLALAPLAGRATPAPSPESPVTFEFSKAGYYDLPASGRVVYDFNAGWRFHKGAAPGAEQPAFDATDWEIVNCPHGLELNSDQVSGGANYQGEAWYRKTFTLPPATAGRRNVFHFEAVMGKCKVWLDGQLLAPHFGGFLPFEVELPAGLRPDIPHVLAVWADNSNDPAYPPGKPQQSMDFAYFGGIYRDVWLVSSDFVYISNPNAVDVVAGGGVLVRYENLPTGSVEVVVQTHVVNAAAQPQSLRVETRLRDAAGQTLARASSPLPVAPGHSGRVEQRLTVASPHLWSPRDPYLHDLEIRLRDARDTSLDGVRLKAGIRQIEFRGKDGFWLNGAPYPGKLVGANRHQDHGYVGNALPNHGQLADVRLLKRAACQIVRLAHYPADPAFMDACDQLGLFVIVPTPGWQFWNDRDPLFEARVYRDIRHMVRRDRHHPGVILWEPILNETEYPARFAQQAHTVVHEEFPFPGAYTASDSHGNGSQYFDLLYSHQYVNQFWTKALPPTAFNYQTYGLDYRQDPRCYFTREWGDCVDNWAAHNSPSRASRAWGERAQLVQAGHYEQTQMVSTDWETLFLTPTQHVGGTLWHAFDHQRGCHTDPFFGGLTDVFRQPKYSFHLFASQRDPAQGGPMIFIAHELTPFSESDVRVYSNCEEVRLTVHGTKVYRQTVADLCRATPHPSVVFKDVFDFMDIKRLDGHNERDRACLLAEGLIGGKVVVSERKAIAQEPERLTLERLDPALPFVADGSDFVTVVATLRDRHGFVRRLNDHHVVFELTGEGEIVGDATILANPRRIEWGTAPVLIRSTVHPGEIQLRARILAAGINDPVAGELTLRTTPAPVPRVFTETRAMAPRPAAAPAPTATEAVLRERILLLEKELNRSRLQEMGRQQEASIGK